MARPKKADGYRDNLGRFVIGNPGVAAGAGRPTMYSKALGSEFVERLKFRTTIDVCEDADMPVRSTILHWQEKYPDFNTQVEASRSFYAEYLLETAQKAVDTATMENHMVAALKFKSAAWRAERVLNRTYGTKTKLVGGEEGDAPVVITVKHIGSGE